MRTTRTFLGLTLVLALVLAACGDDDGGDGAGDGGAPAADPEAFLDDPEGAAGDLAEDLEDFQAREGGGSATLTIGDETWEFDSVLCAFGPEETGRDDTEFVLSSIQDGLQLDATINTEFGHSVSLDDIEDFENPSVSWSATDLLSGLSGGDTEVIEVDGKDVRAEAEFIDGTDEASFEGVPGTLTATCP